MVIFQLVAHRSANDVRMTAAGDEQVEHRLQGVGDGEYWHVAATADSPGPRAGLSLPADALQLIEHPVHGLGADGLGCAPRVGQIYFGVDTDWVYRPMS